MNNLTAWPGHREAVRGLSFSPDDGRFATCSDDSTIRIWAFEESREERVLTGGQMGSTGRLSKAANGRRLKDTDGTSSVSSGIRRRASSSPEAKTT
jgi:WD40 repeat protein